MNSELNAVPMEVDCHFVKSKIELGEPFLLLDCREPDEFSLVKIHGAELWPMSQLAERAGELAARRKDDVVVYCHHGMRSLHVTMWLRQQGFHRASSMSGGIDRWSIEIDRTLPRY